MTKAQLVQQGRWTEPPPGVSEVMWADAITGGYTARFRPLILTPLTEEEYQRIRGEMYD